MRIGFWFSGPVAGYVIRPAAVMAAMIGLAACAWPVRAASSCLSATGLPAGWPAQPHAGQVAIQAGTVILGSNGGYADERPLQPSSRTSVPAFWMDRTEVTNAQFAAFVKATGYVTEAERQGSAAVFAVPTEAELAARPMAWWHDVKGANWRHPGGPRSSVRGKANHPVVHVTQADAQAYARWLGRDLPTEAEWEYAAKAGQQGDMLDGAPRDRKGRPTANYWQGSFPLLDTAEDGHPGVAPVGCFLPNAWGLYDMVGNVWEWTRDAYTGPHQSHANGDPSAARPPHASTARSPAVIKGGSYLCSPDYCVRYRASARESQEPDMPTSHVGFRTVSRPAVSVSASVSVPQR